MSAIKEKDTKEMTDKELDTEIERLSNPSESSNDISYKDMSDEELDAELSKLSEPKEEIKLGVGEKIADVLTGGMITQGKEIQQRALSGEEGEKAKALAGGLKGIQETAKTTGEVGQSVLAGMGAQGILAKAPMFARQKVIQGLVSTAEQRAANFGVRFSNVQRAIQRHAIEGAVAAQPFDYDSIGDRILATAAGAGLSVAVAGSFKTLSGGFSDIGRHTKKIVRSFRDPRIPSPKQVQEEISSINKTVSEINASAGKQVAEESNVGSKKVSDVLKNAEKDRAVVSQARRAEEAAQSASHELAKKRINTSIDSLEDSLKVESDVAAKSYQNKVTGFFRENSGAYGRELDVISDKIAEGGRLTSKEASDVINNTISRSAQEAEVVDGEIIDVLKGLSEKYKKANPTELVDFKGFLNEVRSVWKSARPKGGGRYTQDEIPAAILQSEFGELVTKLPSGKSFQSLQEAYRPVISYMNRANAILKPYKGEAYRDAAYNLVKRVAKNDNSSPLDQDIVNFIENGTERFAKGIGAFSARAKQIGSNIKVLKDEMINQGMANTRRLFDIAEETTNKISRIGESSGKSVEAIQEEVQKKQAMILQEAARLEMGFQKRLSQLKGRSSEIEKIGIGRANLSRITNSLVKIVGGTVGSYIAIRGISEVGRRMTE